MPYPPSDKNLTEKSGSFNTDLLLDVFDKWHSSFHSLLKERNDLKTDVEAANREKNRLIDANQKAKIEFDLLQNTVKNSNNQLQKITCLEDEIRKLKKRSEEKQNEIEEAKKHMSEERQKHSRELEHTKQELEEKLSRTTNTLKTEAHIERELLQTQLDTRGRDLSELEHRLEQLQKTRDADLSRVSIEYENKLARLQRMKTQGTQNQQSTVNSDIFRKKLQNMQCDYESQVSRLKMTIAGLEERLAHSVPLQPLKQRQPLALGKRKRIA